MIEGNSTLAAAVNEMLLQSCSGIIKIFPALPGGPARKTVRAVKADNIGLADPLIEQWKDCHFEGLLAEGAFEVSARQDGIHTVEVDIKSLAGNCLKLVMPFEAEASVSCEGNDIPFSLVDDIISINTQKGKVYKIRPVGLLSTAGKKEFTGGKNYSTQKYDDGQYVNIHTALSGRRIFLGKDNDSDYITQLDNAVFDFYQGDVAASRLSVYKFDFSQPEDAMDKDYRLSIPKQYMACGKLGMAFDRVGEWSIFNRSKGYGWERPEGLIYVNRGGPDPIRQDFIGSTAENKFLMELSKGYYEIYIITGDAMEETYTKVCIANTINSTGDVLRAGCFQIMRIPLIQQEDGIAEIKLSAEKEYTWKVCAMIVNRLY